MGRWTCRGSAAGRGRVEARRGSAVIPALVVISAVAIFSLALLTTGINGTRSINTHTDDYQLSSAVESVAILATEELWSGYLQSQGGAAGNVVTFRDYMDSIGIPDSGPGGPPAALDGTSLLGSIDVPGYDDDNPELNNVNVDAVQVVRRDEVLSTQLYFTVSASTNRGVGIVNPVLNRAVQVVYTVEPEDFDGFDFALLANNVNCIFCHTQVDSVDRYYNTDPDKLGSFDRVKVGTLESLMVRHDKDGQTGIVNHWDADSYVAGTIYSRGTATDHDGVPISDWAALTLSGLQFDSDGLIVEDDWGGGSTVPLVPAGDPPQPLENLYLNYPDDYAQMVDGKLPVSFPPPIPDDGGFDPLLGGPVAGAAGNKLVDDAEFAKAATAAEGAITAGIITVLPEGFVIDDPATYAFALTKGTNDSIQQTVDGHVVLTGTKDDPITLDGMVAIDGDLIISGYVVGEGSLLVKGNVYIPSSLKYLDGQEVLDGDDPASPTGPLTFGIGQDGTSNALGIAAGGSVMIGDYQTPTVVLPDGTYDPSGKYEVISGDADGKWAFVLAEMSLFNKGEWAKTQPFLPGPKDASGNPTTVPNPGYVPGYVPRYYSYGDGDEIPIYNKGDLYFDPVTQTWEGDAEVPLAWDPDMLTIADPNDPADPTLFNADGTPKAVVTPISPEGGWIDDQMYKLSVEGFESLATPGEPFQIDGLIYTNNSIFGMVRSNTPMEGQMLVNGSLVAADVGMLVPGKYNPAGWGTPENTQGTLYSVGMQLNYDKRVKALLNVINPNQVQIKRTLWNPTANIL